MTWRFRKTKRFGPFSITLTHRGVSTSVGAGGLRYQLSGPGKRRSQRVQSTSAGQSAVSIVNGRPYAIILVLSLTSILIAFAFGPERSERNESINATISDAVPFNHEAPTDSLESVDTFSEAVTNEEITTALSNLAPEPAEVVGHLDAIESPSVRTASAAPRIPKTFPKSRLWVSKSGKFTVRATVADLKSESIYLQREDGRIITVPISKLCDEDFLYARSLQSGSIRSGEVIGVSHGDVITVRSQDATFQVRLDGIDAPEPKQKFAVESRKALKSSVYRKFVTVECAESEKDGAVRGHVLLEGQWINRQQAADGWAWSEGSSIVLGDAEATARSARVGLWADENPIPPWDFVPPPPSPPKPEPQIVREAPRRSQSRPSYIAPPSYFSPSPSSRSSGGSVHVRGYYRKDGTYVRPHTRSR